MNWMLEDLKEAWHDHETPGATLGRIAMVFTATAIIGVMVCLMVGLVTWIS